jgi:ATP-binding cassette subfamily B (MDR/TAP) protein 1
MFGASHAGSAQSFGPDMGKALAAAKRIFKIIEYPSSINAMEIDNDKTKIRLNIDEVKGKIEFKNVWFRYPTRKEDFVLKGLSITINPNEQVALVGESGCGKSTFVNLMMRFYDVDSGEILLDGKNIKDINLHDLRKAISLVMQEPIIFNYSIIDNMLYGKDKATNSEIYEASTIANCNDFIERNDLFQFDESAQSLLKEM